MNGYHTFKSCQYTPYISKMLNKQKKNEYVKFDLGQITTHTKLDVRKNLVRQKVVY